MNGESAAEVPRARPLSAGLWTLFSWLRREDHASTDSLSSVGSARTATSFAFLSPTSNNRPNSSYISPPSPSSDTYRKRLRERSLRRQCDRDLTLHRKYGLYRDNHYDVLSLPPALIRGDRHNKEDRVHRAHSECFQQRRAAYVPGKRRAPQPPLQRPNTLPRRQSRKRRAPLPPINNNLVKKDSEQNINNKQVNISNEIIPLVDTVADSGKQIKQSRESIKDKTKQEKGFLKHLFESKKRYSLDLAPAKILPNISELDKQAAEIIEACKLKPTELNNTNNSENIDMLSRGDTWFCTKCLRKFNSTVVTCTYCLPLKKLNNNVALKDIANKQGNYTQTEQEAQNINTSGNNKMPLDVREKQKLKEMLKEMKKSLPKTPNQDDPNYYSDLNNRNMNEYDEIILEAPTLKLGSTTCEKKIIEQPCSSKQQFQVQNTKQNRSPNKSELISREEVVITQPVVLIAPNFKETLQEKTSVCKSKLPQTEQINNVEGNKIKIMNANNEKIHEPLRISSLLNPVYLPKDDHKQNINMTSPAKIKNEIQSKESNSRQPTTQTNLNNNLELLKNNKIEYKEKLEPKTKLIALPADTQHNNDLVHTTNNIIATVEQHSRRRDLINKLEQSIAKGDEKAAAEAAIQLAQLKLNCSVLSFSSQIAGSSSKIKPNHNGIQNKINVTKCDTTSQTSEIVLQKKQVTQHVNTSKITDKRDTEVEKQKIKQKELKVLPGMSTSYNPSNNMVPIEVWVEDKEATRGPICIHISKAAVVGDLRFRADVVLGVAPQLQRWIIGRTLCTDETTPLAALAGPNLSAPFYLCLVEADKGATATDVVASKPKAKTKGKVYTELMQLEQRALITNPEPFDCNVCMENCASGEGAVLRECVHEFCRQCLADLIRHSEEPVVTCPAMGCHGPLQEREIRALVSSDDYERWLARGLAAAESGTRNAFHCRTSDCTGWALCEPGVRRFPCPVCGKTNCVSCQAIHEGVTCEKYQAKLQESKRLLDTNKADEGTQALLDSLIAKGEALQCPECNAVITKKWGCDWVKCSACKTEICWVTRGRRWGPAGRGDTSAGCRCGVDGKKCHPSCGYCH